MIIFNFQISEEERLIYNKINKYNNKSEVVFIYFSLQAQISAYQGSGNQAGSAKYKHNDQLEELRNLQDKLTGEKEAWNRERQAQEAELKQTKEELLILQVIFVI